jgi:GH25 family lysozyme M1 (1,4-beta-N-acetylmuramidase)
VSRVSRTSHAYLDGVPVTYLVRGWAGGYDLSVRWLLVVALAACTSHDDEGTVVQGVTQCGSAFVDGVDVYAGNGTIDWAKVKAAGKGFAFIKATQGDYNTQSTFKANWADAKANGVLRSPYHFFDGTIDGVGQANAFLAELNAAGGLQPGDLPAMLDIECPTSSNQGQAQSGCEYAGNSGWVPTPMLQQRIYDWLDTVEAATGRKAILYSYVSWFAAVGITEAKLADYPLFIASYNQCATIPPPWTTAVFWQYSATGTVTGITGQVDLDHFFGTSDDLNGFAIQPVADAGVTPDADTGTPDQAGCGCHGAGRGHLAAMSLVAFATLLLLRRRSRPRR